MSYFDFDVGIIGGGPAGVSTAAYLAKAGLSFMVACFLGENKEHAMERKGEPSHHD